jgi:hypothetical protein
MSESKIPGTAKFSETKMNEYWRSVHPHTRLQWLGDYRRSKPTLMEIEREELKALLVSA